MEDAPAPSEVGAGQEVPAMTFAGAAGERCPAPLPRAAWPVVNPFSQQEFRLL